MLCVKLAKETNDEVIENIRYCLGKHILGRVDLRIEELESWRPKLDNKKFKEVMEKILMDVKRREQWSRTG